MCLFFHFCGIGLRIRLRPGDSGIRIRITGTVLCQHLIHVGLFFLMLIKRRFQFRLLIFQLRLIGGGCFSGLLIGVQLFFVISIKLLDIGRLVHHIREILRFQQDLYIPHISLLEEKTDAFLHLGV